MPARTHGFSRTKGPERKVYRAWVHMRERCSNPENPNWKYYGGRGIKIDPTWDDFTKFLVDVGLPPSPKHTIERKNNDGDYEPGNVVWATVKEQNANKRNPGLFPVLTLAVKSRVLDLHAAGLSTRQIALEVNCGKTLVWKIVRGMV